MAAKALRAHLNANVWDVPGLLEQRYDCPPSTLYEISIGEGILQGQGREHLKCTCRIAERFDRESEIEAILFQGLAEVL